VLVCVQHNASDDNKLERQAFICGLLSLPLMLMAAVGLDVALVIVSLYPPVGFFIGFESVMPAYFAYRILVEVVMEAIPQARIAFLWQAPDLQSAVPSLCWDCTETVCRVTAEAVLRHSAENVLRLHARCAFPHSRSEGQHIRCSQWPGNMCCTVQVMLQLIAWQTKPTYPRCKGLRSEDEGVLWLSTGAVIQISIFIAILNLCKTIMTLYIEASSLEMGMIQYIKCAAAALIPSRFLQRTVKEAAELCSLIRLCVRLARLRQ
jgi:hypothetical protein